MAVFMIRFCKTDLISRGSFLPKNGKKTELGWTYGSSRPVPFFYRFGVKTDAGNMRTFQGVWQKRIEKTAVYRGNSPFSKNG